MCICRSMKSDAQSENKDRGEIEIMIENQYLIYIFYKVIQGECKEDVIYKAAERAYLDFSRRISFQGKVPVEQRYELAKTVKNLLVKELPSLFQADSQMISMKNIMRYASISSTSMTVLAVRLWDRPEMVNQTLLHLAVIEENFHMNYWNIEESRKYFHVPAEQYVLETASSRRKNKFRHGLNLMAAPLKHEKEENYKMGWYFPGETQPAEYWSYRNILNFKRP